MQLATTQQDLFDYERLEVIHRLPIQQAETEITTLFNRSVRNFIKIGAKLREVHHRFPTVELFTGWFQAKFDGSQRTAYNLMKLAERFSDVSDEAIANIGLSTLYELAAASVPESARQAALQLASDGHQVTTEMADAIIEQSKQAEATAQSNFFSAETNPVYDEIPLCLCGHRADRHPNGDCDDCVCEQYDEAEAGQDDVSIHKRITDEPSPETQYLLGPDCLCGHSPANHPESSGCDACACECYETERVNRANVETLAEVTETTTTQTKTIVEAAPTPDPIAQMKGEADILFDAATINLAITVFPKKNDDRDCMVWLKSGEVSVQSMCKYSQIQDALATFTLGQQMLALKTQLWENAEAKKKANTTPVTTAKTTTKTSTKKGKK